MLVLVVSPLKGLPVFVSMLGRARPGEQQTVVIQRLLVTLLIVLIFLFTNRGVLTFLDLQTRAISVSNNVVLFLVTVGVVFPDTSKGDDKLPTNRRPFVIPLTVPLITKPAVLTALVLLSRRCPGRVKRLIVTLLLT